MCESVSRYAEVSVDTHLLPNKKPSPGQQHQYVCFSFGVKPVKLV